MSSRGALEGVLEAAREAAENSTDLGNRFERLSRAALTAHDGKNGTKRFTQVWGWDDWPGRNKDDTVDTGIDLVAEQRDGSLCAIQCKFYKGMVSTGDVDSFLAASLRPEFTSRALMHTGTGIQRHGMVKLKQAQCDVFDVDQMSHWKVDWWEIAEQNHVVAPGTPRRSVRAAWANATSGSRMRRLLRKYWATVGVRFRNARGGGVKPRNWFRRALTYLYLSVEAVVMTALWVVLAAIALFGWVLLALLLLMLASAFSKNRRNRR